MATPPNAKRPHRRWPWVIGILGLISALWLGLCIRYVAHPDVDPYQDVDAVFILGPAEYRLGLGRELAALYASDALIVTVTVDETTGAVYEKNFCDPQPIEVICVRPDPYTTQGEAIELARLVDERGWDTVAVLTGRPHVSRARLWMERYVQAEVLMWETELDRSWTSWLDSFVYQSAALVKALLTPTE